MQTGARIVRHFEQELEQLKGKLLEMSALVEASVQRSVAAVAQKDRSAAEQVFRDEARINELEMEIDEFAINLLATQQADGSWQEEPFTGTGFPKVFYLKYHMYALYFPLMALSRYAERTHGLPSVGLQRNLKIYPRSESCVSP